MDPLIVFYIDGYVRIGNANYDESDFSNTRNHLTTHTFLGEEGKASYPQLNQRILDHVDENPHLRDSIAGDPVSHVRNQFKESIAMLVDAFKGETFKTGTPLAAEDAFEFYGADCVIDNDLDVWMIEAQDDTGMDGTCVVYSVRHAWVGRSFSGAVCTFAANSIFSNDFSLSLSNHYIILTLTHQSINHRRGSLFPSRNAS